VGTSGSEQRSVAGVILAAGESSRMGRDKALLRLGSETFLERIASVLDGEVSPLVVVLGHHADAIAENARLPASAHLLNNPDYRSGQLSSLHVALRYLEITGAAGALVSLVDHPGISRQVVRALLARFSTSRAGVLIPTYNGRRGHPVVFASRLFEELLAAPLDQGARVVVHAHADEVETVPVEDPGVLWDVDRPEDYEALLQRWKDSKHALSGEPS
jgi:molybdenum cofactor cytidylyltransferase